ncbi:hypothetical protein [Metabacillus bambusae]|uniref:DUF2642 domain-containing protein n=1 Tax=Metabacillus bambusae TaxID=2795218 RepID=A0ABS3MY02_9BACI|nr:hypothetical protein [Metabacillus bambusae]MBO1510716.1 hypothetical protein [Metabacillus bambusae]
MTAETNHPITVDSTISLKGIVKAIFKDTIHVQIGGKVITLPISNEGKLNGDNVKSV